jgi:hypothetical protein
MMGNNGLVVLCTSTQAVPLAAGWPWLTCSLRMTVPGLAVVATFGWGYRAGRYYGG